MVAAVSAKPPYPSNMVGSGVLVTPAISRNFPKEVVPLTPFEPPPTLR
jgi:hypothetical protein